MSWVSIPEELLIQIFSYLCHQDIIAAGKCCKRWSSISGDDLLWRLVTKRDYNIPGLNLANRIPVRSGWKEEYQRMKDETPEICYQVFHEHKDEVLHVSFSNCGRMFVTSSKDGSFIVWSIDESLECRILDKVDMTPHQWKYTWAAKFNTTSTLLLVAGVRDEVSGFLAVFDMIEGKMRLRDQVSNSPYDVMGAWVSETSWLCGDVQYTFVNNGIQADIILGNTAHSREDEEVTWLGGRDHLFSFTTSDGRNLGWEASTFMRCLLVTKIFPDNKIFPDYSTYYRHSTNINDIRTHIADRNSKESLSDENLVLIFLCSSKTSTPHQIGFKRLYPEHLTSCPTITEPDHVIDMLGHIVGICLDKQSDGRYLYVNIRRWPDGAKPSLDLPPPIATEIEMRVLDLQTFTFLDICFTGHKGFTDSLGAFYIYLDTCDTLVASGSEDCRVYVWDKVYGCKLASNSHDNVVNSVAFNPVDQETMVTVGDDHKIKLWISRKRSRQLKQKSYTIL